MPVIRESLFNGGSTGIMAHKIMASWLAGRRVDSVGPDQLDVAAGAVQVPPQRPGGVAVLDAGGGNYHGHSRPIVGYLSNTH